MVRHKIDIKSITKKSSRQVTFSKRRLGFFKKANELATLCDAQVATVVFSPAGKPFSFGQPDVKTVMGCILDLNVEQDDGIDISNEGRINLLNQQLDDLNNQLRAEKNRGQAIAKMGQKSIKDMVSFENLGIDELATMKKNIEGIKKNVTKQISELEASDSLLLLSNSIKSDD